MNIKLVLRPYSSPLCIKKLLVNNVIVITEMISPIFMKLLRGFFCFL